MSELLLLSLRADVVTNDRAARAGDPPWAWLEALFNPYRDRDLACFLCDAAMPPGGADRYASPSRWRCRR